MLQRTGCGRLVQEGGCLLDVVELSGVEELLRAQKVSLLLMIWVASRRLSIDDLLDLG